MERGPAFPPSTTLGLDVVNRLMRSRYVTGIGILGEFERGQDRVPGEPLPARLNGLLEGLDLRR